MAYTIISQNNSTTTLSDGVNTITVPSRVNLTSGNFTIVEVNNNMATLEDGDGNVYRDIPCVATLAGEGGGGGSGLPDQTGHSGEFLTTDGTDASWAAISALQNTATSGDGSLTILGTPITRNYAYSINIGYNSQVTYTNSVAIGYYAQVLGTYSTGCVALGHYAVCNGNQTVAIGSQAKATKIGAIAIGQHCGNENTSTNGKYTVGIGTAAQTQADFSMAIGSNAHAKAVNAIQFGTIDGVTAVNNTDANTMKVANANGNFEIMSADGTIPTARFTTDPSADGTYYPTLTISSGTPTRSWSTIAALQNTATGTASLTVAGVATTVAQATNVGISSEATQNGGTAFGYSAKANGPWQCVAVGASASAYAPYSVSIGAQANCDSNGSHSIALGNVARVTAANAVQINASNSQQTNSDANTFKVANANGNFEIMNANGNLPADRLASTTGLADGNYRLRLTMASGVPTLSWVAE